MQAAGRRQQTQAANASRETNKLHYRIIRVQITRTFVDTINNIHESPRHLFPDNYSKLRSMLISSAQSVSSGVSSITGISLKRSSFIKRLKKSKPISPLPILS